MIEHCSAAAPTVALRNAILEFPHDSYLQHQRYEAYLESTPMVIAAIRATVSPYTPYVNKIKLLIDI
jgi:hypothetical protein